jgi:hypothetical protein
MMPVPIGEPVPVPTSLPRTLKPTRSGPGRPASATGPTTRASPAGRPGPLHPTPFDRGARGGGDAAEVLAAVGRRLDVGPELAALVLVAEAVEDPLTGRRDRDAPAERRTVTIDNLNVPL